ncbi:MAG: F-type H+/Na+-transporting ATPase subunit alpha, partial [Pseudonocardiales bacterium]|nr:F-type H+/Na+-transporting ATPase subunit alpha [Pseudonocardiales bacterium]
LSDLLLSSGFGNPYATDEDDKTMQALHDAILDALFNGGVLPDEAIERLKGQVEDFKGRFTAADGSSVAPKDEPVDAMDEDAEDRESVKVKRAAPSGGSSNGSSGDTSDDKG